MTCRSGFESVFTQVCFYRSNWSSAIAHTKKFAVASCYVVSHISKVFSSAIPNLVRGV